jgi:hypothetical protein
LSGNDDRSQSSGTSSTSWIGWMMGSLAPFTAFTFVPEPQRALVGGVALAMVGVSLVLLWRAG